MTQAAKANLASAFGPPAIAAETAEAAPAAPEQQEAQPQRPPSRQGRKAVVVHLDRAGHRQLRQMALDLDRSAQDLCVEAINDLFAKHGRPAIAGGPATG